MEATRDPGDAWPWGLDFEKNRTLNERVAVPLPAEANAAAVLSNDGPGYKITSVTYVYVYEDRPSISHHKAFELTTGQFDNDRAGVAAKCIGIFCIAYASLTNGTHRLLHGRTDFLEGAGGWIVYSFRVSDMHEEDDPND